MEVNRDEQAANVLKPQIEKEEIARLATLSPMQYDKVREKEAETLEVRVTTLDREVKKLRQEAKKVDSAGMFPDVTPWPHEVDGAELLDALAKIFRDYCVLPKHADTAIALWVLLTYCIEQVDVAANLLFKSPEKRCGKTTLIEVTTHVAHKALPVSNITASAIFRAVEAWEPTLLIDEADTFIRSSDELRGIINSGHSRATAFVVRVEEVNGGYEPRKYSTFCPKVIAMIGTPQDTILDRSIPIDMQRKLATQKVKRLRYASKDLFTDLQSQCARFAKDTKLGTPASIESLNDRAQDNWESLLAIADAAGGKWPELARDAAKGLSSDSDEDDSIRVLLLSDIAAIFKEKDVDRLPSATLVRELVAMEEHPWPEFSRGKELTTRQLARLLKAFSITPKTIRVSKDETYKGYELKTFSDAFARYIPSSDPSHRNNPVLARVSGENASVTDAPVLRIEKPLKPSTGAVCDGVTDRKGGNGSAGEGAQQNDVGNFGKLEHLRALTGPDSEVF